jgi:reductive dehalogenase
MDPATGTRIIKGWARHLGADLVGICRVDPRWAYSHKGEIHYGEWDEWGTEVPEPLPYAVVVATAMDHDLVVTAPHTPSVVESGYNYARGAYITTILAQWLGTMGYRAVAEHNRHYDLLMVPLAIDAGLGELGRQGYLIADKYGPRVRLFAVQTDMPLVPDAPIDLGAERFCEACLKCAESCPSKSIPREKTVDRGILRWKLNEETCFDYWGKIGTDCCVCMAVCPFSRPNRTIHRLVKYLLRRSELARRVFPYVDNFLYGRRWKPREAPAWIAYPKGASSKGVPAAKGDA